MVPWREFCLLVRPHDLPQKAFSVKHAGSASEDDDHGKQELEAELLARADRVVADSVSQCIDHGECFHAVKDDKLDEGSILELGNVIKNPEIGRTNENQITWWI